MQAEIETFTTESLLPVSLFPVDYHSTKISIKDCVSQAWECPRDLLDRIEEWIFHHFDSSSRVQDWMARYGLTRLEAEAIAWWSTDAGVLGHPRDLSLYRVLNSTLRGRNQTAIYEWKDYSWFLMSALAKLPQINCTAFRGESVRMTDLSGSYKKGNTVIETFLTKSLRIF